MFGFALMHPFRARARTLNIACGEAALFQTDLRRNSKATATETGENAALSSRCNELPMKLWKWAKPGKPMLIIIGAFACVVLLIMTRPDATPEERKERAWNVETLPAKAGALRPTLELYGTVQSPQDSQLSAGIEAVVLEMKVRDGDSAAKDDLLIVLDNRDAKLSLQQANADLREAQAQLRFARIRLDRSRQAFTKETELLKINADRADRAGEIFGEGLLSQSDLDTATENLARQQLAVNQAELAVEENSTKLIELQARISKLSALRDGAALDVERTQIRAPFPGVISELQVSEGDRVRVGDTLMRLQNPESVEVRAQLPSRYARTIAEFMQEGAQIPAAVEVENRTISGLIRRIAGQTRAGTGGVDSFIGFDGDVAGLRLGSTVRVLLEMPPEPNVIAVPGEAVYGRNRIFKLTGDRMQMVDVERVGERQYADGRTEVLVRSPELADTDQIVATKLANAVDGLLVKPLGAAGDDEQEMTKTADAIEEGSK